MCGQGRGRTADLSLFRRALVPTELPAPAGDEHRAATLTGLEPATSAVTGRRANQLRYRALLFLLPQYRYRVFSRLPAYQTFAACLTSSLRTPNGIRTRAAAVKGRCPRPLDDGGQNPFGAKRKGFEPGLSVFVLRSSSELDSKTIGPPPG